MFIIFSQTWLRYVWLMAWQIRLSVVYRLWRACTLLSGFNFSGIFLQHPTTHPPEITKIVQEDHPLRANLPNWRVSWSHVWLSHLVMSFLWFILMTLLLFMLDYKAMKSPWLWLCCSQATCSNGNGYRSALHWSVTSIIFHGNIGLSFVDRR